MKPIVIPSTDDEQSKVPFQLPGGRIVHVLRLDYIDEDTVDEMNDELVAQDVQAQLIAVANDVAQAQAGTKLQWRPLLDGTKAKLRELGVEIVRVVEGESRLDEICAPTDGVVATLKQYSDQKPLPLRKRGRETALTMLKYVVTEDELALFAQMRTGQLDQLVKAWNKNSQVTLGE